LLLGRKSFDVKNKFLSWNLNQKNSYIVGLFEKVLLSFGKGSCGSEIMDVDAGKLVVLKTVSKETTFFIIEYC
jgi:hypothetical protein